MLSQKGGLKPSIFKFFYEACRDSSPVLGVKGAKDLLLQLYRLNAVIQLRIECRPLVFHITEFSTKLLLPGTLRIRRRLYAYWELNPEPPSGVVAKGDEPSPAMVVFIFMKGQRSCGVQLGKQKCVLGFESLAGRVCAIKRIVFTASGGAVEKVDMLNVDVPSLLPRKRGSRKRRISNADECNQLCANADICRYQVPSGAP